MVALRFARLCLKACGAGRARPSCEHVPRYRLPPRSGVRCPMAKRQPCNLWAPSEKQRPIVNKRSQRDGVESLRPVGLEPSTYGS